MISQEKPLLIISIQMKLYWNECAETKAAVFGKFKKIGFRAIVPLALERASKTNRQKLIWIYHAKLSPFL